MTLPVSYVDPPDVPVGMTLHEYRRLKAQPARRSPRRWATWLIMRRAARRRTA
jgi:hypothetical protein